MMERASFREIPPRQFYERPLQNPPVYKIQFKRSVRFCFAASYTAVKIGDYVLVEADRGEDIGMVADVIELAMLNSILGHYVNPEFDIKYIIRAAYAHEIRHLSQKRSDENHALKYCREKVLMRKLPMMVVDAEFQYDRNKLTFFYRSSRYAITLKSSSPPVSELNISARVDFRDLLADIYSLFKTRIWMQKLDDEVLAPPPPNQLPYSHPPPVAPVSTLNASAPPYEERSENDTSSEIRRTPHPALCFSRMGRSVPGQEWVPSSYRN